MTQHFKSILELRDFLHKTDQRSSLSALWNQQNPGLYIWVASSKCNQKSGRIMPLDLSSYIYRGQIQKYSPCVPNLFRKKQSAVEKLIEYIKIAEFRMLCLTHPGVKCCIQSGLDVDFIALAQHYGLNTNYLDLTQDIDIACYFATSLLNEQGLYEPITNNRGCGIVYRVHHTHPDVMSRIVLVGKQPFVRPGKQKAWAIEMTDAEDFEELGGIEIFTFDHTYDGSLRIWQQFNEQLYPSDIMTIKAKAIRESNTIYRGILEGDFENFIQRKTNSSFSIQDFYKLINSQSTFKLSDSPTVVFTSEELKSLSIEWEKFGKDFLRKVSTIFCAESV